MIVKVACGKFNANPGHRVPQRPPLITLTYTGQFYVILRSMRFVVGIILIGFGVVAIVLTDKLMSWFGRIAWAEEKLGSEGGTRIFYKLIGVAFILLAFMFMSGRIFTILEFIFTRS